MSGPVVDQINARFVNGMPSNNLFAAGVLVHQFDGMEAPNHAWLPCTESQWCAKYRDRISASLLNARSPPGASGPIPIFSAELGGLVLSAGRAKVLCAYAGDGGTMSKLCDPPGLSDHCVPGCSSSVSEDAVRQMLVLQEKRLETKPYNEVVLDPKPYVEHPDSAIEAVFYLAGEKCRKDQRCYDHSKQVHTDFLSSVGTNIPLLELDPYAWHAPFREV